MAPSRRLGSGLLAFGTIGLVLLVAAAILVVSALGTVSATATDLSRQRDQLATMVGPASQSLRSAATAARNASTSLSGSASAARDGSTLLTQLGDSLDQLASLSTISFLGQKPFAQATASFSDTAAKARSLSTSLATTATNLDTNGADAGTVAADLESLAGELDSLHAELGTTSSAPDAWSWIALEAVALGLLVWLAVIALGAMRLGWRWSRLA